MLSGIETEKAKVKVRGDGWNVLPWSIFSGHMCCNCEQQYIIFISKLLNYEIFNALSVKKSLQSNNVYTDR